MSATRRRLPRADTPDSHTFPTRPYDLVKEFVIALVAMALLTAALAVVFCSPDDKAITMAGWAKAAPERRGRDGDRRAGGTTTSATYGAPYNHAAEGQKVLGVPLQKWAACASR